MLRELNDTTFAAAVKDSNFALVDFYAPWCQPCKALAPLLDRVQETVTGLDVFKVDIEQAPNATAANRVVGVPTLLLMKNGLIVAQKVGAPTMASLVNWIESNR